eukprot:COSAG01_NODE_789_length_13572_cov_322.875158_3_plen_58_part_00
MGEVGSDKLGPSSSYTALSSPALHDDQWFDSMSRELGELHGCTTPRDYTVSAYELVP